MKQFHYSYLFLLTFFVQTTTSRPRAAALRRTAQKIVQTKQAPAKEQIVQSTDLIKSVTIENNTITVIANPLFSKKFIKEPFFVTYDESVDLASLPRSIALASFVNITAPLVWISDLELHLDEMDEDQFYALEKIKRVMRLFYPKVSWNGAILPKKLVKNRVALSDNGPQAATLFSHGLDAVYTAFNHIDTPQILVTICGGDVMLNKKQLWNGVKKHCKNFAHEYGHTNAFVRSNFACFYKANQIKRVCPSISNWFAQVMQGLNYVGLTIPVAYANNCPTIYIGSTRTIDYPYPFGTHPAIDNLISCAGIVTEHDGGDATRCQKIELIKDVCETRDLTKPLLRVCWAKDPNGGNCGNCEKCSRTIAELLLEGENPQHYGFNTTLQKAITFAVTELPKKSSLCQELLWHWGCMISRAQELQSYPKKYTKEFKPIIKKFAALNLASYNSGRKLRYPAKTTDLYTNLWKQAVDRTLTLNTLKKYIPKELLAN